MFNKKVKRFIYVAMVLVFLVCTAESCGGQQSQETEGVDRQQAWYLNYQAVPFYTHSLERSEAIQIYNARNEARATYSYSVSMTGNVLFACPSKGFPLPYGVQLTNSERYYYNSAVLPQAEPNGLFTTGISTSATWVLCARKKGVAAYYSEPDVLAFSFPVREVNGRLVDIEEADSSFTIDLTRPDYIPTQVDGLPSNVPVK